MPRAAPAGAHPAAGLIFFRPRRRLDGRESGAFIKTRPGSRYVGGPVGLAEIYYQNGGDRNSGRFLCGRMEGGRERNARARKNLAMAELWYVRRSHGGARLGFNVRPALACLRSFVRQRLRPSCVDKSIPVQLNYIS